jgi:hypothetical protein
MDFEVGDKIMRLRSDDWGTIISTRMNRVLLVEVRWEATGIIQTLPSQELRAWDKEEAPGAARITVWGNTTPGYLMALRKTIRDDPDRFAKKDKQRKEKAMADKLAGLPKRHKRKAASIVKRFNKN